MADRKHLWVWRLFSFALGIALFVAVIGIWGHEGVRMGRIIAAAVLIVGLVSLVTVLFVAARRRRVPEGGASDIARLLRAGKADEAVRAGRELHAKSPGDIHIAWYTVAALMASGHMAEARRVFATLKPETLPPKMAAMHDDVKRALDSKS